MKALIVASVFALGATSVIAAEPAAPQRAKSDDRRDSAASLFQAYILSEKSVHLLPGKMDFGWSDIPALLEAAKDETITDVRNRTFGRMFITDLSTVTPTTATPQSQAIVGMIALWLVEGIRCGMGESFRPPLYAFCTLGNQTQSECEVSRDVHDKALAAYQAWWNTVKDESIEEAATVDPLAGTGLSWCGPMSVAHNVQSQEPAADDVKAKEVVRAEPVSGLPEPALTIEQVAEYHRQTTGQSLSLERLKELYTSIAIDSFTHGDPSMKDAARRALAFQQDKPTRLKLYSRLVDGYYLQVGAPWPETRKRFTRVLLIGLRETIDEPLPDVAPELPAVGRFEDPTPESIAKHKAEERARREAERVRELVHMRKMFTQLIASEYGYRDRTPEYLEELRALALEYLADETAAKQLFDAAAAYKGDGHDVVPVIRVNKAVATTR